MIWDGIAKTPRFTVKANDGSVIDPSCYSYRYCENVNAGTGYVIVTFMSQYSGTARGWFKIYLPPTDYTNVENVQDGILIEWNPIPGAAGYVVYRRAWSTTTNGWTNFTRWDNTTETSYLDGHDENHKTYAGTRYQYGIKAYFAQRVDPISGATIGGNVGDNYNLGVVGPLKTTVRITTRKLTSAVGGAGKVTLKWEPSAWFTGYQIEISDRSDFSTTGITKTLTLAGAENSSTDIAITVSRTVIPFDGKNFYFRVRSYHEFEGTTYYGGWSNTLSAKCYPKYRAVLIGECSYSSDPLQGCLNDTASMYGMLYDLRNAYTARSYVDLTKTQMLTAIRQMVEHSTKDSVTLFYYSGHGLSSSDSGKLGALVSIDNKYITFSQLATELSKIKGRVIVILDSCHSGAAIKSTGGQEEDELDSFNNAVIEAFEGYDLETGIKSAYATKTGELKKSKFIVITAASYNQSSFDGYFDGSGYPQGAFTAAIIKGMACKYPNGMRVNLYSSLMPADKNRDSKITLKELYSYAYSTARNWTSDTGNPQRAQYYGPDDEVLFCR
jgi:hypothetical protein